MMAVENSFSKIVSILTTLSMLKKQGILLK